MNLKKNNERTSIGISSGAAISPRLSRFSQNVSSEVFNSSKFQIPTTISEEYQSSASSSATKVMDRSVVHVHGNDDDGKEKTNLTFHASSSEKAEKSENLNATPKKLLNSTAMPAIKINGSTEVLADPIIGSDSDIADGDDYSINPSPNLNSYEEQESLARNKCALRVLAESQQETGTLSSRKEKIKHVVDMELIRFVIKLLMKHEMIGMVDQHSQNNLLLEENCLQEILSESLPSASPSTTSSQLETECPHPELNNHTNTHNNKKNKHYLNKENNKKIDFNCCCHRLIPSDVIISEFIQHVVKSMKLKEFHKGEKLGLNDDDGDGDEDNGYNCYPEEDCLMDGYFYVLLEGAVERESLIRELGSMNNANGRSQRNRISIYQQQRPSRSRQSQIQALNFNSKSKLEKKRRETLMAQQQFLALSEPFLLSQSSMARNSSKNNIRKQSIFGGTGNLNINLSPNSPRVSSFSRKSSRASRASRSPRASRAPRVSTLLSALSNIKMGNFNSSNRQKQSSRESKESDRESINVDGRQSARSSSSTVRSSSKRRSKLINSNYNDTDLKETIQKKKIKCFEMDMPSVLIENSLSNNLNDVNDISSSIPISTTCNAVITNNTYKMIGLCSFILIDKVQWMEFIAQLNRLYEKYLLMYIKRITTINLRLYVSSAIARDMDIAEEQQLEQEQEEIAGKEVGVSASLKLSFTEDINNRNNYQAHSIRRIRKRFLEEQREICLKSILEQQLEADNNLKNIKESIMMNRNSSDSSSTKISQQLPLELPEIPVPTFPQYYVDSQLKTKTTSFFPNKKNYEIIHLQKNDQLYMDNESVFLLLKGKVTLNTIKNVKWVENGGGAGFYENQQQQWNKNNNSIKSFIMTTTVGVGIVNNNNNAYDTTTSSNNNAFNNSSTATSPTTDLNSKCVKPEKIIKQQKQHVIINKREEQYETFANKSSIFGHYSLQMSPGSILNSCILLSLEKREITLQVHENCQVVRLPLEDIYFEKEDEIEFIEHLELIERNRKIVYGTGYEKSVGRRNVNRRKTEINEKSEENQNEKSLLIFSSSQRKFSAANMHSSIKQTKRHPYLIKRPMETSTSKSTSTIHRFNDISLNLKNKKSEELANQQQSFDLKYQMTKRSRISVYREKKEEGSSCYESHWKETEMNEQERKSAMKFANNFSVFEKIVKSQEKVLEKKKINEIKKLFNIRDFLKTWNKQEKLEENEENTHVTKSAQTSKYHITKYEKEQHEEQQQEEEQKQQEQHQEEQQHQQHQEQENITYEELFETDNSNFECSEVFINEEELESLKETTNIIPEQKLEETHQLEKQILNKKSINSKQKQKQIYTENEEILLKEEKEEQSIHGLRTIKSSKKLKLLLERREFFERQKLEKKKREKANIIDNLFELKFDQKRNDYSKSFYNEGCLSMGKKSKKMRLTTLPSHEKRIQEIINKHEILKLKTETKENCYVSLPISSNRQEALESTEKIKHNIYKEALMSQMAADKNVFNSEQNNSEAIHADKNTSTKYIKEHFKTEPAFTKTKQSIYCHPNINDEKHYTTQEVKLPQQQQEQQKLSDELKLRRKTQTKKVFTCMMTGRINRPKRIKV